MSLISEWPTVRVDYGQVSCDGWLNEDNDIPCSFEGEVEITIVPSTYEAWWVCPMCGTEHHEPEPDPDWDYDKEDYS